jgi:drug/metabolite transporter (DMT)-like permease
MNGLFQNPLVLVCLFASACYVLTFLTRRIVEAAKPDVRKQADENDKKVTYTTSFARWWNTVILYALAPGYGVLLALCLRGTDYFPPNFQETAPAMLLGLVAGFLSGFLYKLLKKLIAGRAGVEEASLEGSSDDPSVPGD